MWEALFTTQLTWGNSYTPESVSRRLCKTFKRVPTDCLRCYFGILQYMLMGMRRNAHPLNVSWKRWEITSTDTALPRNLQVLAGGATFGGESGKGNPYGGNASQTAFDMAYMLNGKFKGESFA